VLVVHRKTRRAKVLRWSMSVRASELESELESESNSASGYQRFRSGQPTGGSTPKVYLFSGERSRAKN
jgi:hypothetical protein